MRGPFYIMSFYLRFLIRDIEDMLISIQDANLLYTTFCVTDLDRPNLVKLCYSGLVLFLSQFLLMYLTALKNETEFKRGQK